MARRTRTGGVAESLSGWLSSQAVHGRSQTGRAWLSTTEYATSGSGSGCHWQQLPWYSTTTCVAPSQTRIQSCPCLVVESRATATGTQCRRAVPASGAQPELPPGQPRAPRPGPGLTWRLPGVRLASAT